MEVKKRCFKHIARLVKERRLAHPERPSQSELSKILGYKNGQFISNVERGICAIPLKALSDLGRHLSISKDEVVNAMLRDYEETLNNYLGQ